MDEKLGVTGGDDLEKHAKLVGTYMREAKIRAGEERAFYLEMAKLEMELVRACLWGQSIVTVREFKSR